MNCLNSFKIYSIRYGFWSEFALGTGAAVQMRGGGVGVCREVETSPTNPLKLPKNKKDLLSRYKAETDKYIIEIERTLGDDLRGKGKRPAY